MMDRRKIRYSDYLALAILSAVGLAYEVLLLRVFSYSQWTHFASIAVSLALLGFGAAGTFLVLLGKRVDRWGDRLFISGMLTGVVGMLLSVLLPQWVSTRPLFAIWNLAELQKLLLLDFVAFIPFFGIALCIGQVFIRWPESTRKLYCANLIGSGMGALLPLCLLPRLFLEQMLFLMPIVLLMNATTFGLSHSGTRLAGRISLSITILASIWLAAGPPKIPVSDFKQLSYLLDLPDAEIIEARPGLSNQYTVVRSNSIRMAPGLSLQWEFPVPAQDAAVIDSDRVIPLPRSWEAFGHERAMLGYAPFLLRKGGPVAVIGASEWLSFGQMGNRPVEWVQDSSELAQLFTDRGLAKHVHQHVGGARSFLRSTQETYAVIYLVDCFGAKDSTSEDYLLTTCGITAAIKNLRPGGVLAIPISMEYPPKHAIRLITTLDAALKNSGARNPARQVIILRSLTEVLCLVSNQPFQQTDLDTIRSFSEKWSFDLAAFPDGSNEHPDTYHHLPDSVLYLSAKSILADEGELPESGQWYRTPPATDNQPYFWRSMRWKSVPSLLTTFGKQGLIWLDWGILATVIKAVVATVLAASLIILPLGRLPRGGAPVSRGSVFWYFGALGMGFLLLEMAVFQRCLLFLTNPVSTASLVIGTFLVGAGVGSLSTPQANSSKAAKRLFLPIFLASAFAFLVLFPGKDHLLAFPPLLRITNLIISILPLAWFLGRAFPWGLRKLDCQRPLIPWAWGVNGFISVLAAPCATLLSIHFGQPVSWIGAMTCYLLAASIALRWNANSGTISARGTSGPGQRRNCLRSR